jgi:hypothetical protein
MSVSCDFVQSSRDGPSSVQRVTAWFYRATRGSERLRVSVSDATATIVRHRLLRQWSCPADWGGDYTRCALLSEERSEIPTDVTPQVPAVFDHLVVAATNDPSAHR